MKESGMSKFSSGLVQKLQQLTSVIASRATLASKLGESFDGDRELYTACGYPELITYARYKGRFTRQDIAKRIVTAYPDATWRGIPDVYETEDDKETEFEKAWDKLLKDVSVYHYLNRVDKITGIGRYGVLFMGFDDGLLMDQPVENAKELLYLQPYAENHATISQIVTDRKDKRYGLPLYYKLQMGASNISSGTKVSTTQEERVHWSRVIHVAEGCTESDVYGTPRLECVYNRLQDIETITGGSAEMFWRGGFPGMSLEADAGTALQGTAALEDEIEAYMQGLTRVLRLQGIKANQLDTQVANPKFHIEVQLQLISGATGIPVRILTGSERGELASTQDKGNWDSRVDERRKTFAGPSILTPLIDRLIEVGVLPGPKDGYTIEWPDIGALDEKEMAEIAKNKAEAMAKYVSSGAEAIMPPQVFLVSVLGYTDEEATSMLKDVVETIREEDEEGAAAAKAALEDENEDEDKDEE